jgi:hypothetical protein
VKPWALVVAVVGGVLTAEAGGLFYLAGPEDDLAAVSALGVLILLLGLAGVVVAFLVRRRRVSRTVLLGVAALAFFLSAFALAGIMIDHETPIVSVVYLLPAVLMMVAGVFGARAAGQQVGQGTHQAHHRTHLRPGTNLSRRRHR